MRVVIIGDRGLIGGAISEAAALRGMEVYVISRRKLTEKWIRLNVHGIQGDWKDDVFAGKAVEGFYDVIVDALVYNQEQLIRSLDLCRGHCTQYVYISTDSVYEHPADDIDEGTEINLNKLKWAYGYHKRKAELYLLSGNFDSDFHWTIIRPTITFGDSRIPVGYACRRHTYTLCNRILEGKPLVRFDEPNSRHAICHVSTFGNAAVGLFLNDRAYGQSYHISDNQSYTYGEIFEAIEQVLGTKGKYVYVPTERLKKYSRSGYEEMIYDKNPTFTLDNNKIKAVSPDADYHVSLIEMMRSTISCLKLGGVDRDYDLITDTILLKSGDLIVDVGERQIVDCYIGGLSKEYVAMLNRYDMKASVCNILHPARSVLSKLKHKVLC